MRVPRDHHTETGADGVDIQFLQVVQHMDADALDLKGQVRRNARRPLTFVVVTSDGVYRSEGPQRFQYVRPADIPRMDDSLHSRQRRDGLRPKQAVRVGNQSNCDVFSRRVRHRALSTLGCMVWMPPRDGHPRRRRLLPNTRRSGETWNSNNGLSRSSGGHMTRLLNGGALASFTSMEELSARLNHCRASLRPCE